jgi:hypothetical protein
MSESGIDEKIKKSRLGHSRRDVTQHVYTHPTTASQVRLREGSATRFWIS